ncbi:MAG: nitroreductase family deazaflavin-dependent oxidoreductase [Candidatus Binatia bacterium]
MEQTSKPSKLLLATFLRPPYLFHRLGLLGWERFLGQEWIVITTVGRRTGRPHTVMLDLVGHDPTGGRYYVQPGWPGGSDWVRNVEASPRVEAQVGRERFAGRVVRVPGDEGAEWAYRFARKHPIHSFLIGRLILGWRPPAEGGEAAVREWMARQFVFFAVERV